MKFEPNNKRKSHRIDIPIGLIIDDQKYAVVDWSTTGLRADKMDRELSIGDALNISLLLPTKESAIVLNVKAIIRNEHQGRYGMEFTEMNEKNHRVLRHYATLSLDGSLDHIDDLASDLFMTNVQTPMKEPVLLTDKEDIDIHKVFLKKLFYYILFALVFVLVVIFTLLHNYVVIYSENGIVSGNSQLYKAPYDGKIKDIYISQDQVVYRGQLLFEMDSRNDKELLENLNNSKRSLVARLKKKQAILKRFQEKLLNKTIEINAMREQRKLYLDEQYLAEKSRFDKAKKLYKNRLITYLKYREIEIKYSQFLSEYERSKERSYTNRDRLTAEQSSLKIRDQIIAMQKIINTIEDNISKMSFTLLGLKQKIARSTILSKGMGRVHDILHQDGEEVQFTDDIIVVETSSKPYILTKVSSQKVSRIHIGEEVLLYYSRLDITMSGKISAVGDLPNSNIIQSSKDEIVIKIELESNRVNLRLGEYLKVYFLNDSNLSKQILGLLPRMVVLQ